MREDGEEEPEDGNGGEKADREDDADGKDEDMENCGAECRRGRKRLVTYFLFVTKFFLGEKSVK